jgi:uncharacterized membrane protein YkoI
VPARRSSSLGAEEALGEGGDEADLDQQADHGFKRSQDRHRIVELEATREEAPPVERGEAEDARLREVEGMAVYRAEVQIQGGKTGDDCQIP